MSHMDNRNMLLYTCSTAVMFNSNPPFPEHNIFGHVTFLYTDNGQENNHSSKRYLSTIGSVPKK